MCEAPEASAVSLVVAGVQDSHRFNSRCSRGIPGTWRPERLVSVSAQIGGHTSYRIDFNRYAVVPTIALSADNSRFKRETFRGSEFSARVLAENGFAVAMKVGRVGPLSTTKP